jgi:Cd2+/Zn2+-exporting ATPase
MIIKEYDISNLDCANCSAKIESEINNLSEVSMANLDFVNKRLTIQFTEEVEGPLERLNAIAARIEPGVVFSQIGEGGIESDKKPWFVVLAILILTASLWVGGLPGVILGLAAYLLSGHKVIITAGKELISKQLFAENFLMSIATFGALYLGEYTEAAAVMVLYEIGQYLESRALNKSRASINALLSLKPDRYHVSTPDGIVDKKLSEAQKGETMLVYAGERIPLDGVISKGSSSVDTSSLTGEAVPVAVEAGTEVFAGFVNREGMLEITVQKTDAESMLSRIGKLIESATAKKSNTERFITRFARYYTPAVVAAALLVFAIPSLLGYPAAVWFKRALVLLIVSCPCALVISVPLSYYIGLGRAARQGIIFKGSIYLDLLAKVKTLVFDKTGTLTTGELRLDSVNPFGETGKDELLESLYRCEFTSSHPFALAVKRAKQFPFDPAKVEALSEYPGKGVLLVYDKDKLMAGSEDFVKSFGFVSLSDAGDKSAVHVVKNDLYLGYVSFEDELKPGIKEAIHSLRNAPVQHFSMLSGDRQPKAEKVAKELGLDSFAAQLLPEEKLNKLEETLNQRERLLAYCGDGLNDAPVLARADLGIAMGKIGAQASIETADVVLLNDKPEQLLAAFRLSKQTQSLVWQNISLALGIKLLVMASGLAGISGLWEAIIADVGVTLLVIFNSLRNVK